MKNNFTQQECAILYMVQNNLPDSLTPYAHIAKEVGLSQEQVIAFLQKLKDEGVIRRFGASIKHQKTGWNYNVMVAWVVAEENAEELGKIAAQHSNVSHCYFRPSSALDWPYTLYTMTHAHSQEEGQQVITQLQKALNVSEYAALESIEEFKKTSMTYF